MNFEYQDVNPRNYLSFDRSVDGGAWETSVLYLALCTPGKTVLFVPSSCICDRVRFYGDFMYVNVASCFYLIYYFIVTVFLSFVGLFMHIIFGTTENKKRGGAHRRGTYSEMEG